MYQSPLKVRKTEKGASLKRWFKEKWIDFSIAGILFNTDFWNNFRIHFFKRVNNTEDYRFSNIGSNWYFFSKKV